MPEFVNPFVGMVPGRKMTHAELLRALRLSLAAEEEATHLYLAIADASDNEFAASVLRDIANEERVHKGEFHRLIEILAPDERGFMQEGAGEVDEIRERFGAGDTVPLKTVGDLKDAQSDRGGHHG